MTRSVSAIVRCRNMEVEDALPQPAGPAGAAPAYAGPGAPRPTGPDRADAAAGRAVAADALAQRRVRGADARPVSRGAGDPSRAGVPYRTRGRGHPPEPRVRPPAPAAGRQPAHDAPGGDEEA